MGQRPLTATEFLMRIESIVKSLPTDMFQDHNNFGHSIFKVKFR